MTPTDKLEAQTREEINAKIESAGWVIQDKSNINLHAALGVVVTEFDTATGPADYMLFIQAKACGIIEAKREGVNLSDVSDQSSRYATSATKHIQRWAADGVPLPFLYEATNHEIRFRDERDPVPRSRNVFHFHRPETLSDWLQRDDTFRARLQNLPALNTRGLRDCQIDAIGGIEISLKQGEPRALLQMATGAGKTFAACSQVYRLAKFANVRRVLFLVDRSNLSRQALKEFQQYSTPDDGRKFTELYNAHILGPGGVGDEMKVTISTIQRLYSQLTGIELTEETEEISSYEAGYHITGKRQQVAYNPNLPIEAFDVIVIDECHRSIYNLWRQVLDYFDAFLIGLTATPTKRTIGYFNQNIVSEYSHEDAVIDRVNVGYDIYRIKTEKSEQGGLLEAGTNVEVRDRLTKQKRWEILDEDEHYSKSELDRSVIAPNQIRTVVQAFKDHCLPTSFPNRDWVPKTLFFAKDDDHAGRIVDTIRAVFNRGNDFCKKITYRLGKKGAEDTIAEFRTGVHLRIVVTVDMIATGTDIKPLECLVFMRDVHSQAYYEQMKGRGTRVLSDDALKKVTPDAGTKTRFVLVDAVGVTETDKTETKSLEHKPSVPLKKLMQQIAMGDRSLDSLQTLGNRLIRLDSKLTEGQRNQINRQLQRTFEQTEESTHQTNLTLVASNLIRAGNNDLLATRVKLEYGTDEVSEEKRQAVYRKVADEAVKLFHNPEVRDLIETLHRDTDQIIDDTPDVLTSIGYDAEKAKGLIKQYQQFIADHKNELDAIQLIYARPYSQRHLSYQQIKGLAEAITQPPYNIAPLEVWKAYQQLEKDKVRGVPAKELLTNIVSLIRFSTGLSNVLEPFPELVNQRFDNWLSQQSQRTRFTSEQTEWLKRIKDQIANNAEFEMDDFELIPACKAQGGLLQVQALFGEQLPAVVRELNGCLIG